MPCAFMHKSTYRWWVRYRSWVCLPYRELKEFHPTTTYLHNFGFVEMSSIVVWRVAKRSGCLIGHICRFVWLVKARTNLTREEVFALDDVGFKLQQWEALLPHCHLGTMPNLPIPVRISVFQHTQVLTPTHGFLRSFVIIWRYLCRNTKINVRAHCI